MQFLKNKCAPIFLKLNCKPCISVWTFHIFLMFHAFPSGPPVCSHLRLDIKIIPAITLETLASDVQWMLLNMMGQLQRTNIFTRMNEEFLAIQSQQRQSSHPICSAVCTHTLHVIMSMMVNRLCQHWDSDITM